jgi:hypothetical protein
MGQEGMANDTGNESPSDMLNKLSQALTLVARGDPIVSLRAELQSKFDAIETRFGGIDQATKLQHEDMVRVPTSIDRAIDGLRDLVIAKVETSISQLGGEVHTNLATHAGSYNALEARINEKFDGAIAVVNEKITSLNNVTGQQFKSIVDTFAEKDKAVSVGLSAQKEAAAAQQNTNDTATKKMEDNFTKLLDQGRELLTEVRRNTELQINDIKSRLDKGEGRISVSDPNTEIAISKLTTAVEKLSNGASMTVGTTVAQHDSSAKNMALAAIFAALASPILTVVILMATKLHP